MPGPADLPTALYLPTDGEGDGSGGEAFTATALTIGPWDAGQQHAGPPAALLARAVERAGGIPDGRPVRLAFDVLGPVPVGPVAVTARVLRPGRRIELVTAELHAAGRPAMRLSAWRVRTGDPVPPAPGGAGADPVMPAGPEGGRPEDAAFFSTDVAYHRALEWRFAAGTFNAPGPAAAWTRPRCVLVEGEPISPLEHLLVMTDAASGISAALDWTAATFANVELTVSLLRAPRAGWLGMDAATHLGDAGAGQAFAALFDEDGLVGRSSSSLFVAAR